MSCGFAGMHDNSSWLLLHGWSKMWGKWRKEKSASFFVLTLDATFCLRTYQGRIGGLRSGTKCLEDPVFPGSQRRGFLFHSCFYFLKGLNKNCKVSDVVQESLGK